MNGAQLLLKCLEKHNAKKIFGIPGGALLKLYDEIDNSGIEHILTRHEQGAVHSADGYARSTGEVGLCLATSGPGAANLICGLGNAQMDSVPLIAITGQVPKEILGTDAFQEVNTVSLSQAVTKHNYLIKKVEDIPKVMNEAYYIAKNGRPGAVLIDICANVFYEELDESIEIDDDVASHIINKFKVPQAEDSDITNVIEAINNAERPLFLIGQGVALSNGADEALMTVVERLNVPVVNTLLGKGAFPEGHANSLRMLGMHGSYEANYGMQNCDLLINIGSRFDNRATVSTKGFAEGAKSIIHVDIDPSELSKTVKVDVEVNSDSFIFLNKLVGRLDEIEKKDYSLWLNEVLSKRRDTTRSEMSLCPATVSQIINNVIDEDTIVVTDVGQHQMFAANHIYPKSIKSFITSGGLGTMGFGLPAAIGCAFGNPDKNIVLITGDGSFQMNLQELILIREYNLNVKVVIYDNNALGMVRQLQDVYCESNYHHTQFICSPSWPDLAKTYHMNYAGISGSEDIETLKEVVTKKGAMLIGVSLQEETNIFPMVTKGNSLSNIKEGL